jgi:hypothetical protein
MSAIPFFVTPGLDPGVQSQRTSLALDGRVKPGHDEGG